MTSEKDLPDRLDWPLAMDRLLWNADGLLPVTTVDAVDGTVLMAAWVNREALTLALERKRAAYWSRSRRSLWIKGETSGHYQSLQEVRVDCDGDAILYLVKSAGPACHTGRCSCFSWQLSMEHGLVCDRPVLKAAD